MNTKRRMFLAPARSGTTALSKAFSEHPDATSESASIKGPTRSGGSEDYSFFDRNADTNFLIYKASFGPEAPDYAPYPNPEALENVRPLFLFRDPVDTGNSWARKGFTQQAKEGDIDHPTEAFFTAYSQVLDLAYQAREVTDLTRAITYELLMDNPNSLLPQICKFWDLEFNPKMIAWEKQFSPQDISGGSSNFSNTAHTNHINSGAHAKLMSSSSLRVCKDVDLRLSKIAQEEIDDRLRGRYEEVSRLVKDDWDF